MSMPAAVVLDAYPERGFEAAVVKIYPEADRQKGTIKVEVKILKPDMAVVKPEMSAKVTFMARSSRSERQGRVTRISSDSPRSTKTDGLYGCPKPSCMTEVIRAQVESRIDIINDGEMSKIGYSTYVKDRLSGFGGESPGAGQIG
jgi:hypothetical protein